MRHTRNRIDSAKTLHACIVLPTYNEAGNIIRALDMIFRAEKKSGKSARFTLSVLVVDDSSPDGTATLVRSYMKKNPAVKLLLRKEKNGLGAAYIAGMQHALRTIKPDVVMEMDADGQHDASDIPRLLAEIHAGSDFIIGSRYVAGGSIPATWGLDRRIKSACASMVTRIGLRLGSVQDCSGGFRAIRASTLQKIDLSRLHVKGYAFQAVLLEAALYEAGASVVEIPIAFSDREIGTSKMRLIDMIEGFALILRIRSRRLFGTPSGQKVPARAEA